MPSPGCETLTQRQQGMDASPLLIYSTIPFPTNKNTELHLVTVGEEKVIVSIVPAQPSSLWRSRPVNALPYARFNRISFLGPGLHCTCSLSLHGAAVDVQLHRR